MAEGEKGERFWRWFLIKDALVLYRSLVFQDFGGLAGNGLGRTGHD